MKRADAQKKDRVAAFWMLLPFFLFFLAFVLYPLLMNLYYSFTNYNFSVHASAKFVWFDNYLRLFRDGDFLTSLWNTLIYAFFSVILLTVSGLFISVVLNRTSRLVKAARTVMIIPYATSMVAISLIWLLLLDPASGAVNKLLVAAGMQVPPSWLYDADFALPSLIFINVWKNIGYVMILFLAGLQGVPPELYEAATIDGAGAWKKFRYVTLPAIAPVTVFVLVSNCIEAFKTFEQVKIMTKGGPMLRTSTVVYQIYIRAFEDYQMGYAAALSMVLFLIVLLVTLLNFRAILRRD